MVPPRYDRAGTELPVGSAGRRARGRTGSGSRARATNRESAGALRDHPVYAKPLRRHAGLDRLPLVLGPGQGE